MEAPLGMNETNKTTAGRPGRALLLVGVLFAIAGPVLNILLMFVGGILKTPWYAPLLGTLGVALIIMALVCSQSFARWAALAFFTLLAGFGWWAIFAMRTPVYTGPVKSGQPFPVFASKLADGAAFTQSDLQGNQNTVMVFFRGRW